MVKFENDLYQASLGGAFPKLHHRLISAHFWVLFLLMYSISYLIPGGDVRYLDRLQPLALLVMRLALGFIMVVHGYHKVFGGLHHNAQMVAGLGLPGWLGYVSAFTEFLGGLLILAGFFTRCAAFAVFINLAVAIWKVHLHNGVIGSSDHPGYEAALAAAALAFALIFFGGGPIALDHVLRGGGSGGTSKR